MNITSPRILWRWLALFVFTKFMQSKIVLFFFFFFYEVWTIYHFIFFYIVGYNGVRLRTYLFDFWVYNCSQCRNNKDDDFEFWLLTLRLYVKLDASLPNFLYNKFQLFHDYFYNIKTDYKKLQKVLK